MGVEGGRATDYIIRLAKNVRRGVQEKLPGEWPGQHRGNRSAMYANVLRRPRAPECAHRPVAFKGICGRRTRPCSSIGKTLRGGGQSRLAAPGRKFVVWKFLTNRITSASADGRGDRASVQSSRLTLLEAGDRLIRCPTVCAWSIRERSQQARRMRGPGISDCRFRIAESGRRRAPRASAGAPPTDSLRSPVPHSALGNGQAVITSIPTNIRTMPVPSGRSRCSRKRVPHKRILV